MKFTIKTEYGLICLIYITRHGTKKPVTVKEIGKNELFSITFIEKILQQLRSHGIVAAQHGSQGGYTLAKDPSQITLKQIVEALEEQTFEVFCDPRRRRGIVCTHFSLCGVLPVWEKTKELLDNFYETITLDMLANPLQLQKEVNLAK